MRRHEIPRFAALLAAGSVITAATAAAVTTPPGFIYSTQLLGNTTQSCIATGPGGTFVGVGPGFTPNAQSIVLAKESGDLRLVASGFNAISDCAYDAAADVLYVTDNADNADFGIGGPFGALSGDTVFAIPSASTASGLGAPGLELLPADSLPAAASVTVDSSGNVFVSDSAGGGTGSVIKIVGTSPSPFVSGLDFAAGLAFNPANGNLFSAQTLASFDAQIDQYTAAGTPVPPVPFAGPASTFGSYDLAFNSDGRLLVTGKFFGDVFSFDVSNSSSVSFIGGLTFVSGVTVDPFTQRIEVLSSTFAPTPEDYSLHRFTKIDQLTPGKGTAVTECLNELYGVLLVNGLATCTDGAPCDDDGAVNDSCLFPLGFCLNVSDPDFPTCSAGSSITAVAISSNRPSAALAAASAQVTGALPLTGSSCFFTDGFFVPVKTTATGFKKATAATVKVKVTAADNRKDSDRVKLVCNPAP